MRDWVNELTGRDGASSGLRIPSEAEISQVSAMFPNVGRETVVGALQRRCVRGLHFLPTMLCFIPGGPSVGHRARASLPTVPPPFCFMMYSRTVTDEPILDCKPSRLSAPNLHLDFLALPQKAPLRPF